MNHDRAGTEPTSGPGRDDRDPGAACSIDCQLGHAGPAGDVDAWEKEAWRIREESAAQLPDPSTRQDGPPDDVKKIVRRLRFWLVLMRVVPVVGFLLGIGFLLSFGYFLGRWTGVMTVAASCIAWRAWRHWQSAGHTRRTKRRRT